MAVTWLRRLWPPLPILRAALGQWLTNTGDQLCVLVVCQRFQCPILKLVSSSEHILIELSSSGTSFTFPRILISDNDSLPLCPLWGNTNPLNFNSTISSSMHIFLGKIHSFIQQISIWHSCVPGTVLNAGIKHRALCLGAHRHVEWQVHKQMIVTSSDQSNNRVK